MGKYYSNDKENKEVIEEVQEEISESSENIAQPEPPKPLIHIDQFLNTAKQLYNLSNVQLAGFKVHMQGHHYQYDQEVFLQELKAFLNLK